MVEAVIFDVDGTLVDSVDFHAEAWQRTFENFGKTVSFADVRSQIGKGGDQLLPVFLSKQEIEAQGKQLERYRKELFQRDYMGRIEGFPGVRELFLAIRERGKRIALASSAKGDELEAYKKVAGVVGLTEVETSSDDAERSKPHPDIFQAALDKLGVAPKDAIVIGDTPYDAEAARKAGLPCIGLLCGGFPDKDIRGGGATRIYEDPRDLLAHIGDWLG